MMSVGVVSRSATESAASHAALSGESDGRLMASQSSHLPLISDIATLDAGPGPRPSTTQSADTCGGSGAPVTS